MCSSRVTKHHASFHEFISRGGHTGCSLIWSLIGWLFSVSEDPQSEAEPLPAARVLEEGVLTGSAPQYCRRAT